MKECFNRLKEIKEENREKLKEILVKKYKLINLLESGLLTDDDAERVYEKLWDLVKMESFYGEYQ